MSGRGEMHEVVGRKGLSKSGSQRLMSIGGKDGSFLSSHRYLKNPHAPGSLFAPAVTPAFAKFQATTPEAGPFLIVGLGRGTCEACCLRESVPVSQVVRRPALSPWVSHPRPASTDRKLTSLPFPREARPP